MQMSLEERIRDLERLDRVNNELLDSYSKLCRAQKELIAKLEGQLNAIKEVIGYESTSAEQ